MWTRLRAGMGTLLLQLLPLLYVGSMVGIAVPWGLVALHHVLPPGQTYSGEQQWQSGPTAADFHEQMYYVSCPSPLFYDQQSFAKSLLGSSSVSPDDRNDPTFGKAVAQDCQTLMGKQTAGDTSLMLLSIPFGFLWLRVVIERRLRQEASPARV